LGGDNLWDLTPFERQQQLRAFLDAEDLFEDLELMPGARDVLRSLSKVYEIFTATQAMVAAFVGSSSRGSELLDRFGERRYRGIWICRRTRMVPGDSIQTPKCVLSRLHAQKSGDGAHPYTPIGRLHQRFHTVLTMDYARTAVSSVRLRIPIRTYTILRQCNTRKQHGLPEKIVSEILSYVPNCSSGAVVF